MSANVETIIRPFADQNISPIPFAKPGAVGVPPVVIRVGLKGGSKNFAWHGSSSQSTKMGHKHTETAPNSSSLQNALAKSAG